MNPFVVLLSRDHAHRNIEHVVINGRPFVPLVLLFIVNVNFTFAVEQIETSASNIHVKIIDEVRIGQLFDLIPN